VHSKAPITLPVGPEYHTDVPRPAGSSPTHPTPAWTIPNNKNLSLFPPGSEEDTLSYRVYGDPRCRSAAGSRRNHPTKHIQTLWVQHDCVRLCSISCSVPSETRQVRQSGAAGDAGAALICIGPPLRRAIGQQSPQRWCGPRLRGSAPH